MELPLRRATWASRSVRISLAGARALSWPKSANMDLHGRTILITRAASQSEELRAGLEAAGARVIERPAIEIVPVEIGRRLIGLRRIFPTMIG